MKATNSQSIIKKTVRLLGIQCMLLLTVLVAFLAVIYHTASENLETSARNLIEVYGRSLQITMEKVDTMLEQLMYNNSTYTLLQSESESVRYYASVELNEIIANSAAYASYVDAVVVAEAEYGTCLYFDNDKLSLEEQHAVNDFTMSLAEKGSMRSRWSVNEIGGRPYVYKMYVWNDEAVAVYIAAENFMDVTAEETIDGTTMILTDEESVVWDIQGVREDIQTVGEPLREVSSFAFVSESYELENGLVLQEYVSRSAIISQFSISMAVVFLIIVILGFFTYHLVGYIYRQIIHPIHDMQENMEKIQQGDTELRIRGQYGGREFITLRDTFNHLMDEIMNLKIEGYEKQLDLQEAELRAVKLQIRPHFFLNAMTTISSLSQQGQNDRITAYISALSKNIRYMFRSGLHTVPLSEEIKHVENYFEMQEMKYPDSVFYNIEIAPEAQDWPVPQMLIHTIIENEYKYAVNVDQMLTILIKGTVWENEGERLLFLEIEDDGEGYPEDVLEQFGAARENESGSAQQPGSGQQSGNSGPAAVSNSVGQSGGGRRGRDASRGKDGSRVGLWSLRKMMALMYERDDLFTIRNIEPHGCKNTFIIPQKPVHEVRETNDTE